MNRLKLSSQKFDFTPRLTERFMEQSVGNRGLSMMDSARRAEGGDFRRPFRAHQVR